MEKIFYTDKASFPSSEKAIGYILNRYFGIAEGKIERTENGKPYLQASDNLFFSVTHTKSKLFIAFSDKNVGIDAEENTRPLPSAALLTKFTAEERAEIQTANDFLLRWTVKESAVKWLGGTLSHDLKKLTYCQNVLRYNRLEIPVIITTKEIEGHILSVCGERDFSEAEIISFYHSTTNE